MEISYIVIVGYCFIASLWFLFAMKSKSAKNYVLLVSWTLFMPFTFILFVSGVTYYVLIEDFIEWLKKDF